MICFSRHFKVHAFYTLPFYISISILQSSKDQMALPHLLGLGLEFRLIIKLYKTIKNIFALKCANRIQFYNSLFVTLLIIYNVIFYFVKLLGKLRRYNQKEIKRPIWPKYYSMDFILLAQIVFQSPSLAKQMLEVAPYYGTLANILIFPCSKPRPTQNACNSLTPLTNEHRIDNYFRSNSNSNSVWFLISEKHSNFCCLILYFKNFDLILN